MFAGSPSAPGTPVHSIQTMRRKAAGHSGPLTKILVANRGVRIIPLQRVEEGADGVLIMVGNRHPCVSYRA